jgi:hypothetical protein
MNRLPPAARLHAAQGYFGSIRREMPNWTGMTDISVVGGREWRLGAAVVPAVKRYVGGIERGLSSGTGTAEISRLW